MNVRSIELTTVPEYDESDEYMKSKMYISHDGGRDKQFVTEFDQVAELSTISLGELFGEYIDDLI